MGGQQERVMDPVFVYVAVIDGPKGGVKVFRADKMESLNVDMFAWARRFEAENRGNFVDIRRCEAKTAPPL